MALEAEEALALWSLWRQLSSLVKQGLITEEQSKTLKSKLNEKLHEALEIDEK